MAVVFDSDAGLDVREHAFELINTLANQLTGTHWIQDLVSFYDGRMDRREKAAVLMCLLHSEDPRGFPVFAKVLREEPDTFLRLVAANGLAQWNVRSGVLELLELLPSAEQLSNGRTITDEAANSFRRLNRIKGWNCPEKEIRNDSEIRLDLAEKQKTALYTERLKEWYGENQHRFPDWKPGDPLPELEPNQEPPPDKNGK